MNVVRVSCESCRDELDWQWIDNGMWIAHHDDCQPANAIVETRE